MQKNTYGKKGEIIASNYLKKHGYKVIVNNYKNSIGEIDIIARQKRTLFEVLAHKTKPLVFVEVKARTSEKFGNPAEAVDERKQNKIRQVATMFLKEHGMLDTICRFDVIAIIGDDGEDVNHIKSAF